MHRVTRVRNNRQSPQAKHRVPMRKPKAIDGNLPPKDLFFKRLVPLFTPKNAGGCMIYNPGTATYQGKQLIFPRITQGEDYPAYPNHYFQSWITMATIKDGIQYEGDLTPITKLKPNKQYPYGFEDVRVTAPGRDYLMVATGFDGKWPHITLCTTKDFLIFNFMGEIGPRDVPDKDAFFHPELVTVNGGQKFMLYHRVHPNIQYVLIDKIDDLLGATGEKFWKKELYTLDKHTLLKSHKGTWENHIGGGAPPVKTPFGWLFIYHASGVDGVYRGGLAMLDLNKPWKVIAKSPVPILEPTLKHETTGAVKNVVFPQGVHLLNEDSLDPTLVLYYGGADAHTCIAEASLNDLIRYIRQFDSDGKLVAKNNYFF